MKPILLILFLAGWQSVFAQGKTAIGQGNVFYRASQYDLAEKQYRAALAADAASYEAQHNLANALYKQKKYDEAVKVLQQLQQQATEKEKQSAAFYNEGVVYSKQKALEESIEAYKAALRRKPDDKEARENLQKALHDLKKQKQDQQNQQKQKKPASMNNKQAEDKLKDLQAKEKELQEKMNKNGQPGNSMPKDW